MDEARRFGLANLLPNSVLFQRDYRTTETHFAHIKKFSGF